MRWARLVSILLALTSLVPACAADRNKLVVFVAGDERHWRPILERHEDRSRAPVAARYGAGLDLYRAVRDGAAPDVIIASEAGLLADLARRGLLGVLPGDILDRVSPAFRDPRGLWAGVDLRTPAFAVDRRGGQSLPASLFDAAQRRVGLVPSDPAVVFYLDRHRDLEGDVRFGAILESLSRRGRTFASEAPMMEALSRGDIDVALVDTGFERTDEYVSLSAVGIGKGSPRARHAVALVRSLAPQVAGAGISPATSAQYVDSFESTVRLMEEAGLR